MTAAGRTIRATLHRALLCGTLCLGISASLAAQSDQRLRDALRIAQEGNSDSARTIVGALLQSTPPTDSLYPQVLFTMGLVSRNVEDMRRTYTRVAVEYNNSAWADDAIYRLGLLDYAGGNVAGAVRQMDRLRSDYPDSPLIGPASEWAARALFDQKKAREACNWLASGMQASTEDIELRNRLEFLNGRCSPQALADTAPTSASVPPASPTSVPPASRPASPDTPAGSRTGFGVQVGAVNTQAAADKLLATLKSNGFPTYLVKDGALFKVRAGPYADRASAAIAGEKIRNTLHTSPLVVKEP